MSAPIVARLVDSASDRVLREFDLTGMSRDGIDRWWAELSPTIEGGRHHLEPSPADLRAAVPPAASQSAQEPSIAPAGVGREPAAGHEALRGSTGRQQGAITDDGCTTEAPSVRVTRYEVSCVPEGRLAREHRELFTVTVEHRGGDRWAVCQCFRMCADRDGEWDWEPPSSDRTDEWLATHRHDLIPALMIARRVARTLVVNGLTVADVLARDGAS